MRILSPGSVGIGVVAVGGIWLAAHLLSNDPTQERVVVDQVEASPDPTADAPVDDGRRSPALDEHGDRLPNPVGVAATSAGRAAAFERQQARLTRALDLITARRQQLQADGGSVEAVGALLRHEARMHRELDALSIATAPSESDDGSGG